MEYPDVPSPSPSPPPAAAAAAAGGGPASSAGAPPPPSSIIPDRPASPELPLTMTASAVLTSLPRDVGAALASASSSAAAAAGAFGPGDRVVVRFKAVGGAPPVTGRGASGLSRVGAAQRFEAVVAYLRRQLRLGPADGLFLYVNSAFAPALDEVVGNLHRCFKDSNNQLIVAYSITPAFG
ncbi:ubiquitin-like autophagy protein Apg12 [Xylariaceae sp. FL0804]|nr:ubiquitin-like autophagy protein Apg12 [Xylariaceae sp. FL0804]